MHFIAALLSCWCENVYNCLHFTPISCQKSLMDNLILAITFIYLICGITTRI